MRIAIDTSGIDQALVVIDERQAIGADDWVRRPGDPPVLARLDALVRRSGRGPLDLDAVVAARGPGSFTGLRVGLSLAAGLAYARHIPLYLADSLPILARRATGEPVAVALRDAGRREVFAWREGGLPQRIRVDDLGRWLTAAPRVMVEPAGRLAVWLPDRAHLEVPESERRPLSVALAEYANWTFDSQKPLRYDEVQALYVQPAAAEERARKAT